MRFFRLLAALARSYLGQKYYLFGMRVGLRAAFTRYDFCQAMDAMSLHAARGFARRGVPVLLDVNEIPDPFERQGSHFVRAPTPVKRHLAGAFARDMAAATRIVATSTAMADFIAERFGRDAVAIRNARAPLTDAPSAAIRADAGADGATRIIAYPCTAAPHLGVEAAIEMLHRLPANYRLVFVGRFINPAYREEIERLIRRRELTRRVVLKGELGDADYLPYLAGADFGLVPLSFAYRNQRVVLPWRVIDLAAARVPMVATPSEEIVRLACDGDIGEIAASDAPDDLAGAMRRLAASPAGRIAAIKRTLGDVATQFSPAREQARYRAIVATLAPRRHGRAAFVSNLALRRNRRIVEFIDQVCELGWSVDLYCVRAPDRDLFARPERIRLIERSDRPMPRRMREMGRALRRRLTARPRFASLAGTAFGLTLLLRSLRFARAIRRETARRGPWDIVIASDLFALPAGLAAARGGARLIYDATEIPDLRERTAPSLRHIPAALRRWFRLWERAYIRRAVLIVTTGGALARYLRARYRRRGGAPVVAMRNAAEFTRDDIVGGGATHPLRDLLGLPTGDVILVSPCGISRETGALIAVRMLRHLPADHVLVFIGRFSHRRVEAEIAAVLRRERLAHRCFFVGEVAYRTYLRYLADCDIGLALFDPTIANLRLAAPNRLFDLIAMGVPVVTAGIEEAAGLIGRGGIGIAVRERRPAALAGAVRELRAHFGIVQGGVIEPRARRRLDRVARLHRAERETGKLIAALTAAAGPLSGKRVALLTLRSAFSNRRFRRIGAALREAGAAVAAFDTDIGLAPDTADPLPWLTTVAIR